MEIWQKIISKDKTNWAKIKSQHELTEVDICAIVDAISTGKISEKEVVELVKQIKISGMTDNEVYFLSKYMADTGVMLNVAKDLGFCVDKHSAGVASDGMSLVLMSVLSALNIKFVRVVSSVYGENGNLLEKLNTFSGFSALVSRDKMLENARACGVGIIENSGQIAPTAGILYNICKKHNLLIEPIVSASIMANKIATGASLLICDIKSGEGSVVGDNSEELAERLVRVGKLAGIKTIAVVTDFNWPICASVGRTQELQEIKDTLSNAKEYIGSNILKLAKEMVECVLLSTKQVTGKSQASDMFDKAVQSGKAYEKFCQIISCYGGSLTDLDRTEKLIDTAVSYITADYSGYVSDIKLGPLYGAVKTLITDKTKIDNCAGLVLMCAEGDWVEAGQKLAKVYYSHENKRFFTVASQLFASFELSKEKPNISNLFYKVVT